MTLLALTLWFKLLASWLALGCLLVAVWAVLMWAYKTRGGGE